MWNKLGYVALTYYTLKTLLTVLFFVVVIYGPALAFTSTLSRKDAHVALLWLGFPAFMFVWFVVQQEKWQFANPRARLMPGFRGPHLSLLGSLVAVPTAVAPCFFALVGGLNVLGMLAYAAAISAPLIWAAHNNGFGPWMWIGLGVTFSAPIDAVSHFWLSSAPVPRLTHLVIIACSWFGLGYWLYRVATLHEGRPDYEFSAQIIDDRRSRMERAEQRRMAAVTLARQPINSRISDLWLDRLYVSTGRAPWSLLRFGFRATPIGMTFVSLPFATIFAIVVTKLTLENLEHTNERLLIPVLGMVTFMPCALAIESLAGRRPRMAAEVLWPFSRTNYFRQLLNASLLDCLVLWLAFNIGSSVYVWYFDVMSITPNTAVTYLLLGAALQLVAFGLAAHVALSESKWMRLAGIVLIGGGMLFVLIQWWKERDSCGDTPFIAASLVIAALAWPAMLSARRAWSQAELG